MKLLNLIITWFLSLLDSPKPKLPPPEPTNLEKAEALLNRVLPKRYPDALWGLFLDTLQKEPDFDKDTFVWFVFHFSPSETYSPTNLIEKYLNYPYMRSPFIQISKHDLSNLTINNILDYHGSPKSKTISKNGKGSIKYGGSKGDTYKFDASGKIIDFTLRD